MAINEIKFPELSPFSAQQYLVSDLPACISTHEFSCSFSSCFFSCPAWGGGSGWVGAWPPARASSPQEFSSSQAGEVAAMTARDKQGTWSSRSGPWQVRCFCRKLQVQVCSQAPAEHPLCLEFKHLFCSLILIPLFSM